MDFAEGSTAPENQTKPYFAADDQILEKNYFETFSSKAWKTFHAKKFVND